jgi:hypothetical protein
LTFNSIIPDLPVVPTVFKEVNSGLPFSYLIDSAVDKFTEQLRINAQLSKSIYYSKQEDFDVYSTFRAIGNRSEYQRPNVDHLCSDKFSWAEYKELTK